MYYLLAAIFFIVVYFALAKLLSSILKGCLVTAGIFILLAGGYIFLKSTTEPVILFEKIKIENFKVSEFTRRKPKGVLGAWEYF